MTLIKRYRVILNQARAISRRNHIITLNFDLMRRIEAGERSFHCLWAYLFFIWSLKTFTSIKKERKKILVRSLRARLCSGWFPNTLHALIFLMSWCTYTGLHLFSPDVPHINPALALQPFKSQILSSSCLPLFFFVTQRQPLHDKNTLCDGTKQRLRTGLLTSALTLIIKTTKGSDRMQRSSKAW